MVLSRLRHYLLPGAAQRQGRFRQEMLRLSRSGLQTLGGVEIAAGLLVADSLWRALALAGLGAGSVALGRLRRTRERARWYAALSVLAAATLLLANQAAVVAGITLLLLTAVAAVPLEPLHVLGLGVAIHIAYALAGGSQHAFLVLLALLGTAVAVVLGEQRRLHFEAHAEELRIAEALSGAQLRAQLAENAAAIGKLAAVVTHEINTPLGVLKSAVDTLVVLQARQATAPPERQQRLVEMQDDQRRSIHASAERISATIARLQRFINLEEAELKSANLNELLNDAAVLLDKEIQGSVRVEFDLQPMPAITCRPELLSGVFHTLLSNAINAVNGEGRIQISTRRAGSMIEVRIEDNGRGMSAEELENVFDPGFKVADRRVSTGNWSLFNSRQVIFEHGGDISIESAQGKGTTVVVTLPC